MNSPVARRGLSIGLLCALLMAAIPALAEVKGRVRASLGSESDAWLGQQVRVNLDLETTGYSFSDVQFSLPEVAGGVFMQTDSTTIKLSDTRHGETWQILRYPLVLYPQKTGVVTVPPLSVRFKSVGAFGTEPRRFDLRTESLTLIVQRPPGIGAGTTVVTTQAFDLIWRRTPTDTELEAGAALQLEVARRVQGVSGMFLDPIQWPEPKGASLYAEEAAIEDRTNRGALTGERTDRATWVFEEPGNYQFPELAFQWWDPDTEQLKQKTVPATDIEIIGSPANTGPKSVTSTTRFPSGWLGALLVVGALSLLAWAVYRRYGGALPERTPSVFDQLTHACRANDPAAAYRALGAWVIEHSADCPAPSPSQFAEQAGHQELSAAIAELQQQLVDPSGEWQGERLAAAMQDIASASRGGGIMSQNPYDLPDLNPRPGKQINA